MTDPARIALIRYIAFCTRAEVRAKRLLALRQARTQAAIRQLNTYDRDQFDERDRERMVRR